MTDETDVPQDVAEAEPLIQPEEIAEPGAATETPAEVAAETGETETGEPTAEKPKGVQPWVQKRFDELTAQKHAERQAREKAESEAAAWRALAEAGGNPEPTEPGAKTYTEAELEERATALAQQRAAVQALNTRADAAYEAGEKAFGAEWSTSLKNLGMAGLISKTDFSFIEAALDTDAPEQVLHALGQDPDEAMRIAALPLTKRAIAMDRLATKLAKPASAPERKAPAPVAPIDGAASPGFDPEKATMAEWLAWRDKSVAAH